MKKQFSALLVLSALSTPLMAQSLNHQAFEVAVFHTEAGKPMQLAELSAQEMKATEGKFIPLGLAVAGGGAFAAWKYHYDVYKATGRIGTSGGAARAAAIGSGTAAIGGGMGAAAGGGIAGTVAWAPGTFALNQGAQKANTRHTINNRR
ncbi:hypothetical protein [Neisseria dentiae]|uniref:hypothetical protein n=1 Tax=Neisseria dentiae TaxID=194197 RepID=UPI0035A06EF7